MLGGGREGDGGCNEIILVGGLTLALVWERLKTSFMIMLVMLVFKRPTLCRSVNEFVHFHGLPASIIVGSMWQ